MCLGRFRPVPGPDAKSITLGRRHYFPMQIVNRGAGAMTGPSTTFPGGPALRGPVLTLGFLCVWLADRLRM